jgi:hypothetical protein
VTRLRTVAVAGVAGYLTGFWRALRPAGCRWCGHPRHPDHDAHYSASTACTSCACPAWRGRLPLQATLRDLLRAAGT